MWIAVVCRLVLVSIAQSQTSYLMVMSLEPIAIQAGTSSECEVNSRSTIPGTYGVNLGGMGLTAEPIALDMPPLKAGEKSKAINFQEYYSPGGGQGHYPIDSHTVAVGTSDDLQAVHQNEIEIRSKPRESGKITIGLYRVKEVKTNVTLDFMNRYLEDVFTNPLPEGVTIVGSQSKTPLTGSDREGFITLKADKATPPIERQLMAVMASFSINFVMKAAYSIPPVFVSVEKE